MKKKSFIRKLANRVGWYGKSDLDAIAGKAARDAIQGWQAAAVNRLTQSWTTQSLSIDSDLRRELPIIRARSRQVIENNDYGQQFTRMLKNNVLGEYGIALKNKARDPITTGGAGGQLDKYANRVIEEFWYEWGKKGQCTVDRKLSWCDVQRLGLETCAKDGEIIIRKVPGFANRQRYAIQIFEADYLDTEKNEDLPDGRQIRMGIEFNSWMEPIAYHLLSRHPNDNLYTDQYKAERYIRIPADQIIHPFIPFRPHQSRGYPWTTTALARMNMLVKYEEAEVTASRAAAAKMAFLIPGQGAAEYTGDEVNGGISMDAEPGAIEKLPQNMDIKVLDWNHPNSSYQVFMKTCLRGVAAGLGVSYNTLGNDMESVNFASGRLGLDAEREAWKSIQRWFIEAFVQPIFEDWLDIQLLTGQIALPYSKFDKFNAADWRPRRWGYVNPVDEVKAKVEEVRAGFNSITGVLAERGLDRDEVFSELADDYKAAKAAGIDLPALIEPEVEEPPKPNPDDDDDKDGAATPA